MVFMPFPRYRAHALRVNGCGGVPSNFSLSLLVCSSISLETSLTRVKRHLELIVHYAALSISLGMLLAKFLCLETDPPLDCPGHSHSLRRVSIP